MTSLFVGFYGEGKTDYRFLIPIVGRTLQKLLPQVDLLPIDEIYLETEGLPQVDKMLLVAEKSRGYSLVVFHLDADAPNTLRAYRERFEPGYQRVLEASNDFNKDLVPLIPVRMTDAWMLIDFDAFCKAVGTRLDRRHAGFPQHPEEVESIQDPKSIFRNAVRNARPGKRKMIPLEEVYRPLALRIKLEYLERLPAYQEFIQRLTDTLRRLHYLMD